MNITHVDDVYNFVSSRRAGVTLGRIQREFSDAPYIIDVAFQLHANRVFTNRGDK